MAEEQYECEADSWNNGHIDCGVGDIRCEVCSLNAQLKEKEALINDLLEVKRAADGKTELVSNQGQAMDGYSELANYRGILKKAESA